MYEGDKKKHLSLAPNDYYINYNKLDYGLYLMYICCLNLFGYVQYNLNYRSIVAISFYQNLFPCRKVKQHNLVTQYPGLYLSKKVMGTPIAPS